MIIYFKMILIGKHEALDFMSCISKSSVSKQKFEARKSDTSLLRYIERIKLHTQPSDSHLVAFEINFHGLPSLKPATRVQRS